MVPDDEVYTLPAEIACQDEAPSKSEPQKDEEISMCRHFHSVNLFGMYEIKRYK